MKTFQSNKALFLCLIGILIAAIANYMEHLPDLSFVIVGIVSVFVSGESVQRGSAFFAAGKDPQCDTANVIHKTLGNENKSSEITVSDVVSDIKILLSDFESYVEGSEKAIDNEDDES